MTTTRWLIVAFWVAMLLVGVVYVSQAVMAPPPPPVPEKHWFPPPLPGSVPPAAPANAEVHLVHYIMKRVPDTSTFTADVTVQNVGLKKATSVQVKIQPYVGTMDTNKAQPGPDEIPDQPGGDPMANVVQWVTFPDLAPDETSTQTLSFSMRSDADPAQSQPHAEVEFQTAP
jgi:hypothetical protein